MILSDLSVRRPVVGIVMALLITSIGIVGFVNLPVREYPDTDPPVVSVQTVYTGASASVVESRITQPLEDRLAGVEGIETISSRSSDGRSDITIEFRAGRNVDAAANDVRDRVAGGTADRPTDALPPEVRKVDADAQPIMFFFFAARGWDRVKLGDYVDRVIVDRLSALDGVAQVTTNGIARPAMRVWLAPERLAAYRLTPRDVETALRSQNVELPAGRIESVEQNVSLRVNRDFVTPADFARLVIGRGPDSYLVRLGDVARVEEGAEDRYTRFRFNGQTGVGLGIVRQSGANTLEVANAAKTTMAQMAKDLPAGVSVEIGSDNSLYIDQAIKGVWRTLIEAAVLVTVVIFLFLGSWRATIIPMITVPICLLGTFALLWLFGYSINLLTLLALVLAIGLVVDDAIVVLENVHHRIEEGEPPLLAAYAGARQVAFAVIATTLVVCAVFVPVMFLAGQTGLLFRELAVAMIAAVALSGFVALSLAPMLCSKLLRPAVHSGGLSAWIDRMLDGIARRYAGSLAASLARPWPVPLATAALMIAGTLMFLRLDTELVPAEDTGVVEVRLTAPEGTGFTELDRYAAQAEDRMLPLVGTGGVRGMNVRVPLGQGAQEDFNAANMVVFLRHWDERTQTSQDVAREANRRLATLSALRGNAVVRSSLGRGRGQPINFVLAGSSYQDLARARDRIMAAARDNPGIVNLDADYVETKPQLLIDIDRQRAGDLGVSVDDISQTLQTLMGSRRVSTYVRGGEEYRVIVQAEPGSRDRESRLETVYVRGRAGLTSLSNVVRLREGATARELGRFDKMRAITLQGGLAPGYPLGRGLAFLEREAAASPEVLAIGYRGESQALKQTGGSIWLVFAITVAIIYLLLAAQFESFVHPTVIISAVPLAAAGGVIGLAATGGTINLFSQIGIVMLVGLAAKNGILIIEYANQLRDAGKTIDDAIREAAERRLRPILMTSLATVAGAIPLALSHGAGAGARSAIGVVIVFGVTIATAITLYMVPLLYRRLARHTGSPQAVSRRLQGHLAEREAAI